MRIKRIIKKLVSKKQSPFLDDTVYSNNFKSFTGGTLQGTKLCLVYETNSDVITELCNKIEIAEGCQAFALRSSDINQLEKKRQEISFDHIINYVGLEDDDDVYKIYNLLQKEFAYLSNMEEYGSICNVICVQGCSASRVLAVRGLVEGLGDTLSNHGIVINGIIAYSYADIIELTSEALFLSGKYGYLLMGNTLEIGVNKTWGETQEQRMFR